MMSFLFFGDTCMVVNGECGKNTRTRSEGSLSLFCFLSCFHALALNTERTRGRAVQYNQNRPIRAHPAGPQTMRACLLD